MPCVRPICGVQRELVRSKIEDFSETITKPRSISFEASANLECLCGIHYVIGCHGRSANQRRGGAGSPIESPTAYGEKR